MQLKGKAHGSERPHEVAGGPDDVKPTEVGAEQTSAWLALFSAGDQLVGLDYDAETVIVVLRWYLLTAWWGSDPFPSASGAAPS